MNATDDRHFEPPPGERVPQRLLLVCPSARLVGAATAAGFAVRVLADANRPGDGEQLPVPVDFVDLTDGTAVAEAVERAVREHRAQTLLAFADAVGLPAVTRTAARLGVSPNAPDAEALLGEPARMRVLLNGSRRSYVAATRARTARELPAAMEEIGAQVTVRPLPASPEDGAAGADGTAAERSYLVEKHLEGPEYGVVTLTADGMHRVIGIAALHGAWQPGSGCLFPALLKERDEAETRAVVAELLDLAGYEFGFAYTVVVLTPDGPKVARSRACYPDEPLASLIGLATGFCFEDELFQALAGKPVQPPLAHRYAVAASYRLPAGRLVAVTGLEAVAELPGVHQVRFPYTPGDRVPGCGRVGEGRVVLTAASVQEAARTVAAAERLLRAEVSRQTGPA